MTITSAFEGSKLKHAASWARWALALQLMSSACACATTTTAPHDARAAGGTPTYHPVPLRQLAFGRPQPGVGATGASERAALDAYLLPKVREKARVRSPLPTAVEPRRTPARQPMPSLAREAAPAAATPSSALATNEPVAVTTPSTAQRYAERETRSQQQQQYRGGDVLVITASTLVIVLLIVLIIVLLLK